jgi:hypothetical protein
MAFCLRLSVAKLKSRQEIASLLISVDTMTGGELLTSKRFRATHPTYGKQPGKNNYNPELGVTTGGSVDLPSTHLNY